MTYDKKARLTPNSAEYQRVHRWVIRQAGKADCCVNGCKASRYHWSNISRDYLLDMSDWEKVCVSCHKKRDKITTDGLNRIREANKINSLGNANAAKPVLVRFPQGSWVKVSSTVAASRLTGVSRTSIANILSGLAKRTHSGFTFERIGG